MYALKMPSATLGAIFISILTLGGLSAQSPDLTGTYRIRVKANNRYLHEHGDGDRLISTRYQFDDDYTRFRLSRNADASYKITTIATKRFWHDHQSGDQLISTRYNFDDDWNKFLFEPQSDGSYFIRAKPSGRLLHEDGGGDRLVSTRYQPAPPDDHMRFFLEQVTPGDISGTYRIRVKADDRYLHEHGDGDKLISTRFQFDDDYTRFRLSRNQDGSYKVTTVATNRFWHDHQSGDKLISTRYNFNDEWNKFLFDPQADGSYLIRAKASGRLVAEDGHGDKLLSTRYQPTPIDDFSFFYLESVAAPLPGSPATALRMAHSGMCLAASGLSSGALIVQQKCAPNDAGQSWSEVFVSSPWAVYVNSLSGLCLEPAGDVNTRGTFLSQAPCSANRKEQWFHLRPATLDSDQSFLIPRLSINQCADIEGGITAPGARLLLWTCLDVGNQRITRFVTQAKPANEAFNAKNFILQNVLGIEDPDPEICWKRTTTRPPSIASACPASHPQSDGALLCSKPCPTGYAPDSGLTCSQVCPAGWSDEVAACRKPNKYTRNSHALNLLYLLNIDYMHREAKARCEAAEGRACELVGALYYPTCNSGFEGEMFAPNVCAPVCQNGMRDSGVGSCYKNSYIRDTVPSVCPAGMQRDPHDPLGLCFQPCPSNSTAVGVVCWAGCGGEYGQACGAACARSIDACVYSIGNMITETEFMVLNIANMVLTAGAGTPSVKAAQTAARKAGKIALSTAERATHKASARNLLQRSADDAAAKGEKILDKIADAKTAGDQLDKIADSLVHALEEGELDYRELLPTAADFDPTGILSVIRAFNKPICK